MSRLIPEKPSRMDNGGQLFYTYSVIPLGLHCCTPSMPVKKSVNSFLMGFQGCSSQYYPRRYMPEQSNRRGKTLWAAGARVCLQKYVHGREKSCQQLGFVNCPHNFAGRVQRFSCYINAQTKLPFHATRFFDHCTSCTLHKKKGMAPPDNSLTCSSRHIVLCVEWAKSFM